MYLWTYSTGAIAKNVWNVTDPSSAGYRSGKLVRRIILYTILSSVIFGFVIVRSKPSQRKFWYSFGLVFGGIGLISIFFIHNQWLLIFLLY